jgi:DMSO/TMAO reductase YedYZ molybdopterin-dependent catalytic subunit
VGVGEAVASLRSDASSPLAGAGRALIDAGPGPAIDAAIAVLEHHDKSALLAALLAGAVTEGTATVAVHRRGGPPGAALGLLGAGAALRAAAVDRRDGGLAAPAAGGVAGASALIGVELGGRRGAAAALAGGLAAGGLALVRRRACRRHRAAVRRGVNVPAAPASAPPADLGLAGLSPMLTPPGDFYVTDVTFPAPDLDPRDWRLRIHGLVDRPAVLSLDDLLALGPVDLDATLVCVHNPVGGSRIGTARWTGVPLEALLERAGVHPAADAVMARSVDGFSAKVPLSLLEPGQPAMIALGMNGRPLPRRHGHPARLLMPGYWGADANTKWLAELELVREAEVEAGDYWDRRGWPATPPRVRPGSRIDVPREGARVRAGPVTVAGVAWAPPDGVIGVEVELGGGGWRAAELGPELGPAAWRQWRIELGLAPGEHRLRVRAAGRAGDQRSDPRPPYPTGTSGLHEVRVVATSSEPPPSTPADAVRRSIAEAAGRLRLARAGVAAWARHGPP